MNRYNSTSIDCWHCYDSGLCYASDNGPYSFFMICDCAAGDKNDHYRIPRWSKEAARLYSRQKFILDDWVPKDAGIWSLIEAWREKISQAEKYWANEINKMKQKEGNNGN